MLRLLVGFKTKSNTEEDPEVLCLSHSSAKVQEAIDAASGFERVMMTEVALFRKARRSETTIANFQQSQAEVQLAAGDDIPGPKDALEPVSLEDHTVDELREIAAAENADLTGASLKSEIIEAIELNRAPLDERTVEQLRELAAREQVDLTGLSRKADIISAIELARDAQRSASLGIPENGEGQGPSLPV